MSRLPTHDPETAPASSAKLLSGIQAKLGMIPNFTRSLASSSAGLGAYLGLAGALEGGSLTARVKEQLALVTAETNECNYCLAAHSTLAAGAGLSAEEILDSRRGRAIDRKEDGALALARRILAAKGAVEDADLAAARAAGLEDGEIVEVVAHVALNVFTNYFARLSQVEIDFPRAPALEAA